MATLETKLLNHDSSFTYDDTYEGQTERQGALMSAFRPKYAEGNNEGASRIHLNVERWRVPETWFRPGMAGVDVAGLGELLENVLKSFSVDERQRLVNVSLPCLVPRLSPLLLILTIHLPGHFPHWWPIPDPRPF